MRALLYLAALALAACGGSGPAPSGSTPSAPATPSSTEAAPPPAPVGVELLAVQEGRCAACHALGGDASEALKPAAAAPLTALALRPDFEGRVHFA
ncbi:MAG: hypothetical protein VYD05_09165, partial [Planctomycetota bacterium]|nr:hypothetical protein [Planctomycetota bacterium]